jgi:hypothetical protein
MTRLQLPRIAILTAVLLGLSLGACSEDFAPYNRLTQPRVLAIASDPPAPATGETATFSAVLYLPDGIAVDSYEWSWCPFAGGASDGYPCLVTEEELEELGGGAIDVPSFDLGNEATAVFENTIPAPLLDAICTGTPDQPSPVDCFKGFPAQVKLVMRAGDTEITSIRRLRLRFDESHEANELPVIEGLDAVLASGEYDLDDSGSVILPRGMGTVIHAHVPTDTADEYTDRDDEGELVTELERLTLSWFVESGNTDHERTSFIDGLVSFDDAVENEWNPALLEDYAGDTARIIVVIRDNRDGVAFTEATVGLGGGQ